VESFLFAPFAKLIERNLALNLLFVLPAVIIYLFAGFAGQFNELIL
jgi:hypothetical protein